LPPLHLPSFPPRTLFRSLTLGLSARVLFMDIGDAEQVFFETSHRLLPAVVSGTMLAAVLSAIMSTADSQILVTASSISHDWNLRSEEHTSELQSRENLVC